MIGIIAGLREAGKGELWLSRRGEGQTGERAQGHARGREEGAWVWRRRGRDEAGVAGGQRRGWWWIIAPNNDEPKATASHMFLKSPILSPLRSIFLYPCRQIVRYSNSQVWKLWRFMGRNRSKHRTTKDLPFSFVPKQCSFPVQTKREVNQVTSSPFFYS